MPDRGYSKIKTLPLGEKASLTPPPLRLPDYVELQAASNFSMLRGASHPEEIVAAAAQLGYRGIALTDWCSLSGIVRAHTAAVHHGIRFYPGCRIALVDERQLGEFVAAKGPAPTPFATTLLLYPKNRNGYGDLCSLLTIGKLRGRAGRCFLTLADLLPCIGQMATIIAPAPASLFTAAERRFCEELTRQLLRVLPPRERPAVALTHYSSSADARHIEAVSALAQAFNLDLIASNDVWYHAPERRMLHDVITCVREGTTVAAAGFRLAANGERHLKTPQEIARLFRRCPELLRNGMRFAERLQFSLDELRYEYPREILPAGKTPLEYLTERTWDGAAERYPRGVPETVRTQLAEEFKLIHELGYEKYFLTCYDIVRFARSRGILCQGRGAAANSAVCYCLGITSVDPAEIDLLFARFVSRERNEPPDIDIDFEHERREEVIQYIYERYGRHRAGLVCEVITYRHRSAIRDVGKALGLSLDLVGALAKSIHRWDKQHLTAGDLCAIGVDPQDRTVQQACALSRQLLGFPRHFSQHVGGFVISEQPLSRIVPIMNATMDGRTIIEWDKDDIELLGMLKIDILALGMLSCIRKSLEMINRGLPADARLALHSIPQNDPETYEMISRADTIGVFQIESRAQMSMLPRLKPSCFYDLVIEVAIVRPGPIQGNMVHPYLRRRKGLEKVSYPDKRVEEILGKTYGVPLFQEQAMRLAIVLAGCSPGEAEQLRRAMATWKRSTGTIAKFQEKIVNGMISNGYTREFAEICMHQIRGFSEYGFPESHAASFALLVYASSWLKRHYPAHFAAALLNSQPMGFYAPAQIISDARAHDVEIRPIDVNFSGWDCTIENSDDGRYALRLGLRLVKGLLEEQGRRIADASARHRRFSSISDLYLAVHNDASSIGGASPLSRSTLLKLASADAFQSMNLKSREALWQIRALPARPARLERAQHALLRSEAPPLLPPHSISEQVYDEYKASGFSLKTHPIALIRGILERRCVKSAAEIITNSRLRQGCEVWVAGLSIVRQRPGTARGVVFITLEDESGFCNLILMPDVYERFRHEVLSADALLAGGKLERADGVCYLNVRTLEGLDRIIYGERPSHLDVRSYSY